VDTKEGAKRRTRRRHDNALKRLVLAECAAPGASVATVAMAHGINANLVHKWRREFEGVPKTAASFVPVTVGAVISEPPQFIEFEVQRGAISVSVRPNHLSVETPTASLGQILLDSGLQAELRTHAAFPGHGSAMPDRARWSTLA
jgi:transposase